MAVGRPACILVLLCALAAPSDASFDTTVVDVPSRSGVTQRFLYLKPPNPVANIVLLTGGDGILGIGTDGSFARGGGTLLVRTRKLFAWQDFAVAVVDAPSDRINGPGLAGPGLTGFRQTFEHLTDLVAVGQYMRQQANVPTWAIGLSFGAISAAYAGINLPANAPLGVVLVSATTRLPPPHTDLLDLNLAASGRPTLVVHNELDQCGSDPASDLPTLMAALASAPVKELFRFTGGSQPVADPCGGSQDYHGFWGLDTVFAAAVGDWIGANNGALGGAPSPRALAVEFYHAGLDHYFISALLPDLVALGTGQFAGWAPTLEFFPVYTQPVPGASPVCRFYIPPPYGDSHFYSASPSECAQVRARFPFFSYESPNVFQLELPDPITGACPPRTFAVYRAWNNRADTNHRYTTNESVRDAMVASGWVAEGYGPKQVIMCSPA